MKKNEFYTVTIEDLTHEGLGVGKVDGFPLFIENSIPGEVVRVKTMKIAKSYGYARVEEWLEVSPNRVEVKDALGTRVGTMPLQICHAVQFRIFLGHHNRIIHDFHGMDFLRISGKG